MINNFHKTTLKVTCHYNMVEYAGLISHVCSLIRYGIHMSCKLPTGLLV